MCAKSRVGIQQGRDRQTLPHVRFLTYRERQAKTQACCYLISNSPVRHGAAVTLPPGTELLYGSHPIRRSAGPRRKVVASEPLGPQPLPVPLPLCSEVILKAGLFFSFSQLNLVFPVSLGRNSSLLKAPASYTEIEISSFTFVYFFLVWLMCVGALLSLCVLLLLRVCYCCCCYRCVVLLLLLCVLLLFLLLLTQIAHKI